MNSLYSAYQAYEKRVVRGEMDAHAVKRNGRSGLAGLLLARLGDVLILAGLHLKRQPAAGMPMAWSPLTGSKP